MKPIMAFFACFFGLLAIMAAIHPEGGQQLHPAMVLAFVASVCHALGKL